MDQRSFSNRTSTRPRNSLTKNPDVAKSSSPASAAGVEFTYLYAAMHPGNVAGIIAIDGFIPTHPMRIEQGTPGQYAVDIGGKHLTYDKRHTLMQMVIDNPDQPAPIPKYKTARENLEHVMYDAAPGNGAFANMPGGYSDAVVLAKLLIAFDRYWPSVQDGENPFTPGLARVAEGFEIPVIAFASTNFGANWPSQVEAASKSTGRVRPFIYKIRQLGPSRRVGRYEVREPGLRADRRVDQAA